MPQYSHAVWEGHTTVFTLYNFKHQKDAIILSHTEESNVEFLKKLYLVKDEELSKTKQELCDALTDKKRKEGMIILIIIIIIILMINIDIYRVTLNFSNDYLIFLNKTSCRVDLFSHKGD